MDRLTCPRAGCDQEIRPASVCCPSCYRLIPAAIRVDLEACIRTQRAWTADLLWQRALSAALAALARTVVTRARDGYTIRAHHRRRRRRAGAA